MICIEGFTTLIKDFENHKLVQGIKVARTVPPITHMFFADDSYIFCKVNVESADNVMTLLRIFEQASGHQINNDKTLVFISKNAPNRLKNELGQRLRFMEANERSLYLDLPNVVGRNKFDLFKYLKEKLQGWDKKNIVKRR